MACGVVAHELHRQVDRTTFVIDVVHQLLDFLGDLAVGQFCERPLLRDWQAGHASSPSSLAVVKAWVWAIGIRRSRVSVPSMSRRGRRTAFDRTGDRVERARSPAATRHQAPAGLAAGAGRCARPAPLARRRCPLAALLAQRSRLQHGPDVAHADARATAPHRGPEYDLDRAEIGHADQPDQCRDHIVGRRGQCGACTAAAS